MISALHAVAIRHASLRAALRRATAWLVTMALLLQITAGLATPAQAQPWQAELGGRPVICTAAGMVVLDQDGTIPAEPGMSGMCLFCLPLLHAGLTTPDMATVEPVRHFARAEPFADGNVAHSPLPVHDHTSPRAPPIL